MSDDYFFGDEDFDNSAFIAGLDAFEAAHNVQQQQVPRATPMSAPVVSRPIFRPSRPEPAPAPSTSRPKPPPVDVINISDDDEYKFDDSVDLESANWEEFDQRVETQSLQPQNRTAPIPGPSTTTAPRQFGRTLSGKLQQQTLWGVPPPPENRNKLPPRQKGKTMKKTKTWDRTEYAKSGWRAMKKPKDKSYNSDGEEEKEVEQEEIEFEQFPQPANFGEALVYLFLITSELSGSFLAVGYGFYPCGEPIGILTCGFLFATTFTQTGAELAPHVQLHRLRVVIPPAATDETDRR